MSRDQEFQQAERWHLRIGQWAQLRPDSGAHNMT